MSDNINGIHYEISKPKQNPNDGYYYQRVRQVDDKGNLVGVGEQTFRSAQPDSTDGLFGLSIDLAKAGSASMDIGQVGWGIFRKDPRTAVAGATKLGRDISSGIQEDYKSWPGTEEPWFDWQTGSPGSNFDQGSVPGKIGDGNGIGNWWGNRRPAPQNQSSANPWTNIPVPNFPPPPQPAPRAWNFEAVRDSAAAAGIPSRNNVFEYGFPDSLSPAAPPNTSLSIVPPRIGDGSGIGYWWRSLPGDNNSSTSGSLDPNGKRLATSRIFSGQTGEAPAGGLLGMLQAIMPQAQVQPGTNSISAPNGAPDYHSDNYGSAPGGLLGRLLALQDEQARNASDAIGTDGAGETDTDGAYATPPEELPTAPKKPVRILTSRLAR